jgi:hypothetical protein
MIMAERRSFLAGARYAPAPGRWLVRSVVLNGRSRLAKLDDASHRQQAGGPHQPIDRAGHVAMAYRQVGLRWTWGNFTVWSC